MSPKEKGLQDRVNHVILLEKSAAIEFKMMRFRNRQIVKLCEADGLVGTFVCVAKFVTRTSIAAVGIFSNSAVTKMERKSLCIQGLKSKFPNLT